MISAARIFLTGATGTIGRAVLEALQNAGYETVCFGRSQGPPAARTTWHTGDVTDAASIATDGLRGERFDAVISCIASRTGVPDEAWAIDHGANAALLKAATGAKIPHFTLLSAICVQKPKLAFQHAKLAFETELKASALDWTIIRPTAFFKSLTGQLARVQSGKPYHVFGDGRLTACKPISDRDLARFIVSGLGNPAHRNQTLAIGGPGPALTPRDVAEHMFKRLDRAPTFQSVPVWAMRAIAGGLTAAGALAPPLKRKAALARIGLYYGTESMLHWDPGAARYDADATPETGADTLPGHIDALISGRAQDTRGAHAVFMP
ncbi:MAG: NAD(P)H-binding protein [Pseudomonadota bacterium]